MGNVLLVMGHRNTSGGNAEEAQRTPLVVVAAARALRDAGHTVHVLQQEDGDADPNFTHADLAFVARQCAQLIKQHRIDVMIDAHFQGGTDQPRSGCFCIFPDGNQLNPPPPIDDGKLANQQAVAFAQKLASAVSQETGIPLLPLSEPGFLGGMSERQTGVGSGGDRLGMFRLTVPPPRCVRVVMEHGDIDADSAVINNPGFFDRVARAYVRAVDAFWPVVVATPEFFAFPEPRQFTTQAGAIGRRHASTDADIVRHFGPGESVQCVGYYESQLVDGDNRWLRATGDDAPRIHRSGVLEEIPVGVQSPPPGGEDIGLAEVESTPSSEESLAREQARQRGGDPDAFQIMTTSVLGCEMVSGAAPATPVMAEAEAVTETEADTPVGYPVEITPAERDRSDYVGIEEHGKPDRAGIGIRSLITSAVWGGRPLTINTFNGQFASWDPCQTGERCDTGCGTGCCWYNFATAVCLPFCTHPGMDIGVPKHTALYAAEAGTVEHTGPDERFYRPNHVDIRTSSGELHIYAHMWSVDPDVVLNGRVRAGQFLGTSGEQTIRGTLEPDGSGPHLHFERRSRNECAIDPTNTLQQATTILFCSPSAPPTFDGDPHTVGNTVFRPDRRTVECAFDGLGVRRWGDIQACTTRRPLTKGEKIDVLYWVEGQDVLGEDRWWVATDGSRFHVGGTVEKPQ